MYATGYMICATVLMLYGRLTEALLYGAVLYLMLFVVVYTIRLVRYLRKCEEWRNFIYSPDGTQPEALSVSEGKDRGKWDPNLSDGAQLHSGNAGKGITYSAGRGTDSVYAPDFPGERELCERIEFLREQCARLSAELINDRRDYMDYYTVWVHEIKTPISAMQMILQNELGDSRDSLRLQAELFRINRYVEMALGYVRLESDSKDLVIRKTAVDELIRQAVRKYAPQFIERKLKLEYEPVSLRISTDEKWFVFVLEQILSNAVKYTKTGGVSIRIDDEDRLAIRDTGIGIAGEDIPRIFEKGYTGFNGRQEKKATGLGLYLCRRICDMLSVGITAESVPGRGSTFYLDLKQRRLMNE